MKKVLIGLIIIIGLFVALYFYYFHLSSIKKGDPLYAVPANAALIIQLDDPYEQWKKLTSNKIWNYLKSNAYLSELGENIDSLNTEVQKNESLWSFAAARPLVVSMHRIRANEYNYLYIVDLQRATQLNFIKSYADQFVDESTKVLTRDYNGSEIIELAFDDSPTRFYLTINDNLLAVSTTHTLIEQSIDQLNKSQIARDLDFVDINRHMNSNRATLYLQHKFFTQFLSQWLSKEESVGLSFFESTKYTGINIEMADDHLALEGFSNVSVSAPSFLRALRLSGQGDLRLPQIAPENTSFFMSLGFEDANTFYGNLEENIVISEPDYLENKEKLERFLDISIDEHFLSWMNNEVGIIQLHTDHDTRVAEFALAIRFNNREKTKENLDYIKNQIRKKTPVKFRGVDYQGHKINFLSIKGFFKIIFGKAFDKIDKPYYTIMEDYVVFSNTPKTLGKIIRHYNEGLTLNNNKAFADYMDRFERESTLFVYLNSEQLITDSRKFLDDQSWKAIIANRDYIESFPMVGLQFNPSDNLLAHRIVFKYAGNSNRATDLKGLFTDDLPSAEILSSHDEESIAIEDILPDDLTDKMMNDYYPNGQLKYEVSLKKGMKHGRYFEYDSMGNVIIKGRYKNDAKSGTWKFYNAEGDVERKEKF